MEAFEAILTRRSTRRQVLDELAALVQDAFAQMEVTPGMYRSLRNSITASQKGGYVFHYGAPVRSELSRTGNPVTWVE